MIDVELQGRVNRKHVKVLQSAFLSPVVLSQSGEALANPPTETVWPRSMFVSRRFHPTPASKFTTGIKASKLFRNTAHSVNVGGIIPELHTWVNITRPKKRYVTGNLWESEKTIMSLPRSEVSS